MKVRQQFPHLPSIRLRPADLGSLESLLDLIPNAALLIDLKKQSVLLANPRFAELSLFTRNELVGKPLTELFLDFPDIKDDEHKWSEISSIDCILRTRTRQEIDGHLDISPIDSQNQRAVIQVTTESEIAKQKTIKELERNRWEAIRILVLAAEQTSNDAAVDQILQSAHLLTGADILGIYLRDPLTPESLRLFRWPENTGLPAELSFGEISHLQVPHLWKPGDRGVSPLHTKAISERLAYLATVPIDQSNPLNGIFIAADKAGEAHPDLLPTMNLIASSLSLHLLPTVDDSQNGSKNPKKPHNREEKDFIKIFDALDEGLILLDSSLRIRAINLAAESILGVRSAEMVGLKAEDILISSPSITPGLMEVNGGTPVWKMEDVNLRHRKGQSVPASVRVITLASEDAQDGMAVIFTDLSDEEQYRARAQQLEQQAFLGEVSAIFAHEVRNPINNISTGLELMSMDLVENEGVQDQIRRIQDDFERLTDLMKSVLSFSGRREYQIMRIDLVTMVDKILDRWRVRSPQNNISFHFTPPGDLAIVEGDQRAIEQVLTNLISNSVMAMEESGGDLTIKLASSQDETNTNFVEILISDTGPGIPAEVIEHIFEPFYTTKKEGTGLGLAISKRIVEAHKGKISAQSFPGVTIFKVVLPAIEEPIEENRV